MGDFVGRHHGISGTLYVLNDTALLVREFTYDGTGPDAFFWAGDKGDSPSEVGHILPYPFRGVFCDRVVSCSFL